MDEFVADGSNIEPDSDDEDDLFTECALALIQTDEDARSSSNFRPGFPSGDTSGGAGVSQNIFFRGKSEHWLEGHNSKCIRHTSKGKASFYSLVAALQTVQISEVFINI